jgi:hypothetical protein
MITESAPDPDAARIASAPRELDSRVSDGIHVQLLWHPLDGHVSVAVDDSKTGQAFELRVRHGERALDVFNHPYAYADDTSDRGGQFTQASRLIKLNHWAA